MGRKTKWPPQLENFQGRARLRWTANKVNYCFPCGEWDHERDCPTLEAEEERLRILRDYEAGIDPRTPPARRERTALNNLQDILRSLDLDELDEALENVLAILQERIHREKNRRRNYRPRTP